MFLKSDLRLFRSDELQLLPGNGATEADMFQCQMTFMMSNNVRMTATLWQEVVGALGDQWSEMGWVQGG